MKGGTAVKNDGEVKHNNTGGKRFVFLLILVIAVVIAFSWPMVKELERVIEDKPPEGKLTFNASRYFFRYDYPENWAAEKGQGGFLMDRESGLVSVLTPTVATKDMDGVVFSLQKYDGVKVRFYYLAEDGVDYANVTLQEVLEIWEKRIREGLISGDYSGFQFTPADIINVGSENTDLYSSYFKGYGDEANIYGYVYCAKRPKCCYMVMVTYDKTEEFSMFKSEIEDVVKSFRLTVLAD